MTRRLTLDQIRKRKMVQWGVAYLGGAFVVFQGLEVMAAPWGLSNGLQRTVHVLLLLGFFVTLVVAWYHGEKGKQRVSGPELLIIALLLFITAGVLTFLRPEGAIGPDDQQTIPAVSTSRPFIAVLPLANLSGREEDAWFTEGMHGQILTQLSKIGSLGVISSTSVQEYRATPKNLRQVATELGAGYIAEGEVLRAGNQVRVNIQLIDAATDSHVWADSYDRFLSVENLLDIQAQIARSIAMALEAAVTPEEDEELRRLPTQNLQAYEYFVQANEYRARSYTQEDMEVAVLMLERAVALDSTFSAAYAWLGAQHARLYHFHYDRSQGRLEQARVAIERAASLDPGLPDVHFARGMYRYYAALDYEGALEEFSIARRLVPNDVDFIAFGGFVKRRQGRMGEALEAIQQAFELDPRRSRRSFDLAETYRLNGQFGRAEEYYDLTIDLDPDHEDAYVAKADLFLRCYGETEKAREILSGAPPASESGVYSLAHERVLVHLFSGEYQQGLDILKATRKQAFENQFFFVPTTLLLAEVYQLMGETSLAEAHFEIARADLLDRAEQTPEDARLYGPLGIALAGLGRGAEALRQGQHGVDLLPVDREIWRGFYRVAELIQINVMVSEHDRAVDLISEVLSRPSYWSQRAWHLDPRFQSLQEHPQFRKGP